MAYKNYYFKRGNNISGIDLPDKVEGENFFECTFHPNCETIKFVNCHFSNCNGLDYLTLKDCDNNH